MNLAILIIEGPDEALETVRQQLDVLTEKTWISGQPTRRGSLHATSGFSVTIADAESPGEMLASVREFVALCTAKGVSFSRDGLSAEVSIGMTVGDSIQFVASLDLSPSDLLLWGGLGVAISVAAYPASDE
jgi:hypothetical protein